MVSVHDLQALEAGLEHGTAVDLAGTSALPSGELVALLAQGAHTSPAAIMLTDASLDEPGPLIRYVNPACEALTGCAAADLIGKTPRILQGPATDRAVLDAMRAALTADRGFEGRVINYRADGTPFVMRWRLAAARDAVGAVTGYLAVQDDDSASWLAELRVHERISVLQGMIAPPTVPDLEHLDVAVFQEPVDNKNHVGGDWCDVIEGPDGRVHLIVGDITGHGVLAALQVGRFRSTLRALLRSGVAPEAALRTLADVNDDAPVYASVGLVSIDRSNRAEIITAGHPDVIVSRRGGHERIRSDDPLVGIGLRELEPTPVAIAALEPGDVVCVYRDGLVERRDEDVDQAIDRVARWVDEHPVTSADGLREHADRMVRDLRGERPGDDVLVVMARVTR
jgi:PAS domain S-box-containing protein